MQHTLRNVPPEIDAALRREAHRQGRSMNQVALDALAVGLGVSVQPIPRRSLADLVGTWVEDPAVDDALAAQRVVDEEDWR